MNFSLNDIIQSKKDFKRCIVGNYETPSALIFKPFFYFAQGNAEYNGINTAGLLGNKLLENKEYNNSALGYLSRIEETIRAKQLANFRDLLAYISTYMPWYFHSISGLNEALQRDFTETVKSERKKIVFNCLDEAVDLKLQTLINLYRSACFSWEEKKEIVPANLRKFDMGLFICNNPLIGQQLEITYTDKDEKGKMTQVHLNTKNVYDMSSNNPNLDNRASSIYLEFRNCEIDYNSGTEAYSEFSNEEMLTPKPQLIIYYDDCYEVQFNEFMSIEASDLLRRYLTIEGTYEAFNADTDIYNDYTDPPSQQQKNTENAQEEQKDAATRTIDYKRNNLLRNIEQYTGVNLDSYKDKYVGMYNDVKSQAEDWGISMQGGKIHIDKQSLKDKLLGTESANPIEYSDINPNKTDIQPYTYNVYGKVPAWDKNTRGLVGDLTQAVIAETGLIGSAKTFLNKLWLGNVHDPSLGGIVDAANGILNGSSGSITSTLRNMGVSGKSNKPDGRSFGNVYKQTFRNLL